MSTASTELAIREGTPQVVKRKPFAGGKIDPSVAGKMGAQKKEANALARIGEARGLLGSAAPRVARQAIRGALGQEKVSSVEASLINSVLDRTVGKAPTEIRVGMADQTLTVLRMLEDEE